MAHWLIKSDPEEYGIEDLSRDKQTEWTGVRSYAARNHLRAMKKGDDVLVYHSGKTPAVIGLARVAASPYSDPTSNDGDWTAINLLFYKALQPVTLATLKSTPAMKDLTLLRQSRLSVMPVSKEHYNAILQLSGES